MKKRPKITRPKLLSPWRLVRDALREYRANLRRYLKIVAVVAVPINILGLLPSGDATGAADPFSAFTPFVAIIMNVALIWAIIRRADTGTVPTVAQAYYDGSAALVRYLLVSCAIVIMLLPAAFGATFFGIGVLGAAAAGSTLVEELLIGFVCLLLAAVSGYLVVRHAFASFAAIREGYRPVAALRLSRSLTKDRFWPIAGRMAAMVVFVALVSIPSTAITVGLSYIGLDPVAGVFFEIVTTLISLPLANLYLFGLYRELERTSSPARAVDPAPVI